MAGFLSKYQPFCVVSRYLICLLFLLRFERLGQRISQTARGSRTIPRTVGSTDLTNAQFQEILNSVSVRGGGGGIQFRMRGELFEDYDHGARVLQKVCDMNEFAA